MLVCNQVTYTVSSLHVKTFKAEFQTIVALANKHKGCQKFEFYQYDTLRENFLLIEIFKSEKNERKFKESSAYQNALEALAPMIEETQSKALRLTTCLTKQGYWSD